MKRLLLTCAALIIFTAAAFAYKVGDIIEIGGDKCVIFDVTTDGQHGKAMSVSQTECNWKKAKTWCARYGRGWRLPKKDELKIIYSKKEALNSAFTANGYEVLGTWYWSSEEYDSDHAWAVGMFDGYTDDGNKGNHYYVRAVSAF